MHRPPRAFHPGAFRAPNRAHIERSAKTGTTTRMRGPTESVGAARRRRSSIDARFLRLPPSRQVLNGHSREITTQARRRVGAPERELQEAAAREELSSPRWMRSSRGDHQRGRCACGGEKIFGAPRRRLGGPLTAQSRGFGTIIPHASARQDGITTRMMGARDCAVRAERDRKRVPIEHHIQDRGRDRKYYT